MIPERYRYLDAAPCPIWLKNALGEIRAGVFEVSGPASNPRIIEYRRLAKVTVEGEDSVVAWCAIGANAMFEMAGIAGTRSTLARSFTRHPSFEKRAGPCLGAVTVLKRPGGAAWQGHVGFYVGEDGLFYYLAGANQQDGWTVGGFQKSRLVGFYWPKGHPRPPAPWDAVHRLLPPPRGTREARDR